MACLLAGTSVATSPQHPLDEFEALYATDQKAAEMMLSGYVRGIEQGGYTTREGTYDVNNASGALGLLRNASGRIAKTIAESKGGSSAKAAEQVEVIRNAAAIIAENLYKLAKPRDRDEAEMCGRGQKAFSEIVFLERRLLLEAGKSKEASELAGKYAWIRGLATTQPEWPGVEPPRWEAGRFEHVNWHAAGRHFSGSDLAIAEAVKTFLKAVSARDVKVAGSVLMMGDTYADAENAFGAVSRLGPKDRGSPNAYQIDAKTRFSIVEKDGLTKLLVEDILAVWADGKARIYLMCDVIVLDDGPRLGFAKRESGKERDRK